KQLMAQSFDKKEPQTHGINIATLEVHLGETPVKAHLWDFGGQEIMHATHQFFLSRRSLYILVLDSRKEDKTEYWLKHIRSFGGDSPVLVVLNKIDQNPGFEVNGKYLKEKYPNITGFYRISCARNIGIEEVKSALATALESVEIIGTTWGGNWFKVKTRLENMTRDFISFERYKEVCAHENIHDETAVKTLLDLLNDLGVILNFNAFQLEGTHILEPRWVTEGVYKIINSQALADAKGLLALHRLEDILKQKDKKKDFFYPKDKYAYLIALMKEFQLCYEIDPHHVLVPDLLEVQESPFQFDYARSLRFIIDYDFLPRSLLPRFIVRLHNDIKDRCRWRTGVLLESESHHAAAVVKAHHEERRIAIYVTGEGKRDYFAVIRHAIGDILAGYEKITAIEKVPLPDHGDIEVEYVELIGHELAGEKEIFIGKLGKRYNVGQLLNGVVKPEDLEQDLSAAANRNRERSHSPGPVQPSPPPPGPASVSKSVFISYSHKDRDYLERLKVHLKPLVKKGLIDLWEDTKLNADDKWRWKIEKALKAARVAVLLVSADFLASDFIEKYELPPLLEKAERDGTRIIPLIVKPSSFTSNKHLSVFQSLNNPEEPLSGLPENEREEIYVRLFREIEDLMGG
ncbi:MAG: TIR domain-containing protein, partial [bacterium]|nr:TIR domain-containing protein [bacterium]